jgi:hypothetical protein
MTDATRNAVLQLLGAAMSDISEECWCAGWLLGSEYYIPELCRRAVDSGHPQRWGPGEVTMVQALGLVYLAEQLGCWAALDSVGVGYVAHQPFPVPPEYLAELGSNRRND